MPVVGSGDDDGVDVLAVEHRFVIPGGEELVFHQFLGAREMAVVQVGGGDGASSGDRLELIHMLHAANADTDEAEPDSVVRGAAFSFVPDSIKRVDDLPIS